ncbi:unnamed protein product [Lepidochelys olivacea]
MKQVVMANTSNKWQRVVAGLQQQQLQLPVMLDNMKTINSINKGGGARSTPLCIKVVNLRNGCICQQITFLQCTFQGTVGH